MDDPLFFTQTVPHVHRYWTGSGDALVDYWNTDDVLATLRWNQVNLTTTATTSLAFPITRGIRDLGLTLIIFMSLLTAFETSFIVKDSKGSSNNWLKNKIKPIMLSFSKFLIHMAASDLDLIMVGYL